LVLRRELIPGRLARHVQIGGTPDWPCPVRLEGRVCYVWSGDAWIKQGKPLAPVEARFVQALIEAHPERVPLDVLKRKYEIRSPSKTCGRVIEKLPDVIDRAVLAWKSYGFARQGTATNRH
jgi:hypothetical protein